MAASNEQIVRFVKDHAGRRIAYAEVGAGPVLLCPAWWVSHVERDWEQAGFRAFFSRLAQHFRVVRYDRLGVGLSDRDAVSTGVAEEADTVLRLLDQVDAEQSALLAISCAGPVAAQLAADHPARISRLCFFNAYANGADLATPDVRQAMLALIDAHWGLGSKTLADIFAPEASGEELEMLSRSQRAWTSATNASALMRLAYSMDASASLARVQAPARVIHRTGDRAIPFEAGRRLAAGLPDAGLVAIDSNVHPPWLRRVDDVGHVLDFLLQGQPTDEPAVARGTNASAPASQAAATAVRAACELDAANRGLLIDGQRVQLTPLEWGVMALLVSAAARVVTRDELLTSVWRTPFAGSNKVEATIRTLRRKLGAWAGSVETVTGHGYRFAHWQRAGDTPRE